MASCFNCKEYFNLGYNDDNYIKSDFNQFNEIPTPYKTINYDIFHELEYENNRIGSTIKKIEFLHKTYPNDLFPWIKKECFSILKTDCKTNLIVLRIINNFYNDQEKLTILYNHENSTDLSSVYSFLVDLSTQLKVKFI